MQEITIGIIGAIGVDDIGDIILLEQSLMDIISVSENKKIKFIVFSQDTYKSEIQLQALSSQYNIEIKAFWDSELTKRKIELLLEDPDSIELSRSGDLLKCNALFFIGGGYFNSYWEQRLWSFFVFPIKLFGKLQRKVYISGVTLGPFNTEDELDMKGVFIDCHTLSLRDHSFSIKQLKNINFTFGNLNLTTDDILIDWNNLLIDYRNDFSNGRYIVFHLFHWLEKYAHDVNSVYEEMAQFIDGIIERGYIDKVLFMPFNNFRNGKKGGDYIYGEKLKGYLKNSSSFELLEPLKDYREMRMIISNAEAVIANRYHPIIFGLGEMTPSFGIYVNDLYKQKLQGAYEVVNIIPEQHTLHVNEFSAGSLMKWYENYVLNKTFPSNYSELVAIYRKRKLKSIKSFIEEIKNEL